MTDEALNGGLIFAALILILLVAIWISTSRHPKSNCPRCNGTGRLSSGFLTSRWRDCPSCSGGVVDRRAD